MVALLPFIAARATSSDVSQPLTAALLLLPLAFVVMGIPSYRPTIKVVGVGGHTVSLHTYLRDSRRVQAGARTGPSKATAQSPSL